jgi:DNA-binding CsgD family transcriptional regulator
MTIRYRPLRSRDIPECTKIVRSHPILGRRYARAIADLGSAWQCVLDTEGFASTAVFEELDKAGARILGLGISVFVSDDFLREVKTPPFLWIGPELARRILRGCSPLLSFEEVAEANSRHGLNLVVWQLGVPDQNITPEVASRVLAAFLEGHRGFLLKEFVQQAESVAHVAAMRKAGVHLLDPEDDSYREFPEKDLIRVVREPHVVGLTREMALSQRGSWVASLFHSSPPQVGFSRSEQRLLSLAMSGETDEELSRMLQISLSGIKKAWRRVYDRAASHAPEIFRVSSSGDGSTPERGKEKKHLLIAYVREHPEELRPVSRKLLKQDAQGTRK